MTYFVPDKQLLALDAAGVAHNLSPGAPYAMAGDDDGDGIVRDGAAYGLGRGADGMGEQG